MKNRMVLTKGVDSGGAICENPSLGEHLFSITRRENRGHGGNETIQRIRFESEGA